MDILVGCIVKEAETEKENELTTSKVVLIQNPKRKEWTCWLYIAFLSFAWTNRLVHSLGEWYAKIWTGEIRPRIVEFQ